MNGIDANSFRQVAAVNQTSKLIALTPLSGDILSHLADEVKIIYLEPGAAEAVLGQALLEALNMSRFIKHHEDPGFFSGKRVMAAYRTWIRDVMKRGGYKTERDAHGTMLYCRAKRAGGKISIEPNERDRKPRYWSSLPQEETVTIPETDDPAIVGAALKLALARCR